MRLGDAGCWSGSAPYLLSRNCSPTARTRAMRCVRRPPNNVCGVSWELVAPPKANRRKPWALNRAAYRARNAIERYFGRIKRLRGIANRYHQLAHVYLNQVLLACIHFMTK